MASEEAHHILERVSVVTVHTGTNFGEHLAVGVCTGGRYHMRNTKRAADRT